MTVRAPARPGCGGRAERRKDGQKADKKEDGKHAGDPGPVVIVLFGASGDLARRLVLPGFYRLVCEGLVPDQWRLVGNGRGDISSERFRAHVRGALTEFGPRPVPAQWDA